MRKNGFPAPKSHISTSSYGPSPPGSGSPASQEPACKAPGVYVACGTSYAGSWGSVHESAPSARGMLRPSPHCPPSRSFQLAPDYHTPAGAAVRPRQGVGQRRCADVCGVWVLLHRLCPQGSDRPASCHEAADRTAAPRFARRTGRARPPPSFSWSWWRAGTGTASRRAESWSWPEWVILVAVPLETAGGQGCLPVLTLIFVGEVYPFVYCYRRHAVWRSWPSLLSAVAPPLTPTNTALRASSGANQTC